MIARRFWFQVYDIFVHVPDVLMPDAQPFATMYKYNRFYPASDWTASEQDIAARALREVLANPRKTTESTCPIILPNS